MQPEDRLLRLVTSGLDSAGLRDALLSDLLLEGFAGPQEARLLRAAAIPHQFTRPMLQFLFPEMPEPGLSAFFAKVERLTFVKQLTPGRWAFHDESRRLLLDAWRQERSSAFTALNRSLAEYYAAELTRQREQPQDGQPEPALLEAEILYHRLVFDEPGALDQFQKLFQRYQQLQQFSKCYFLTTLLREQEVLLAPDSQKMLQFYLARSLLLQGQYPQAEVELRSLAGQNLSPALAAGVNANLAELHRVRGEWGAAIALSERNLEIFSSLNDRSGEAWTLSNMAILLRAQHRYEDAIQLYARSLALMQELGDEYGRAWVLHNLGGLYSLRRTHSEDAIEILEQSVQAWADLNNPYLRSQALVNLGRAYELRGDLRPALAMYLESLALKQAAAELQGLASVSLNLGRLYTKLGEWEPALEALRRCEEIYTRSQNRQGLAVCLHLLANVCKRRSQWEQAGDYFAQARQIYEQLGDKRNVAVVLSNLGEMNYWREQYLQASRCFEQASKLWREVAYLEGEDDDDRNKETN